MIVASGVMLHAILIVSVLSFLNGAIGGAVLASIQIPRNAILFLLVPVDGRAARESLDLSMRFSAQYPLNRRIGMAGQVAAASGQAEPARGPTSQDRGTMRQRRMEVGAAVEASSGRSKLPDSLTSVLHLVVSAATSAGFPSACFATRRTSIASSSL